MRLTFKCLLPVQAAVACLLFVVLPARAQEMSFVLPEQVDMANSSTFEGAKPVAAPAEDQIISLLGVREINNREWKVKGGQSKSWYYRLAFKAPVEIGSIFSTFPDEEGPAAGFQQGVGRRIAYLKPTATFPGDVTKDDQWIELPPGRLNALPPGTKVRALRFSDRYATPVDEAVRLGLAVLFKERYYSALNIGQSKIVGREGQPETWLGSWNEPLVVAGAVLLPFRGGEGVGVEALKPDADEHPVVAASTMWKRLLDLRPPRGNNVVRFPAMPATRGLRLLVPKRGKGSSFGDVVPLVNLGERAQPPGLNLPPAPFKVNYNMPLNGFAALEIRDKKTNKVVRRLIAEVPRDKGPVAEPWDLLDETKQLVPPGEYTWKTIARPPFKLTYEMTVNNAGQPAWWAPPPGKGGGGWLADHSAPIATCAVGDMVFLGSPVSESGQSLIAVDHEGNKLWGEGALQLGFFGPTRIATDGRSAYLIKDSFIQRVDPKKDFATRTIYETKGTRDLPGGPIAGAAGRGDKLYVSYRAPAVSWLAPSFPSDLMDPSKSMPLVRLQKGSGHRTGRGEKNYQETEYDELMKFYAAFLTENMPEVSPSLSGGAIPSSEQAVYGDAPTAGPLAGTLTVVFKKPVPVGSITLPDTRIKAYALKPGAKLPQAGADNPDPDAGGGGDGPELGGDALNEEEWIPLTITGVPGKPGIALAPEGGLRTVALRFKTPRLSFALVLARRMTDIAPQAERVFVEGKTTERGGWRVSRDPAERPITKYDAPAMAMIWKDTVKLRGVALLAPTPNSTTAVDYYIGPADKDPRAALKDDSLWKQGGSIAPEVFNGYFAQKATLRSIDFGNTITTRALRIRTLEPEGYRCPPYGNRPVKDEHKAGFDAIVAYSALGGDLEMPVELNERVTEFELPAADDTKTEAKVLRHLQLAKPGFMAFDKAGTLYAVSDGQIVTVPLDGTSKPKVVVARDELEKPEGIMAGVQKSLYAENNENYGIARYGGIAFDADGALYVADIGAHVLKVFDVKTGKFLRIIGTPGGPKVGTWDESRFENPVGITFDSVGKLWVAESRWQPKRISRWSRDGKIEKSFLGPTGYGGGGWLDEGNKNVLNFDGMKFVMDWDKRTWKLQSILFCQGLKGSTWGSRPDRAVYFQGKRYLVGDPYGGYFNTPVATICVERNDVAVPMVVAGNMGQWNDIDMYPDLQKAFGGIERELHGFVWCDKNGDGVPQAAEVQVTTNNTLEGSGSTRVGEDLSLNFNGCRLRPTGFSATGAPQYDLTKLEKIDLGQNNWTTSDGRTFVVANRLTAPDGKTALWDYPDKYVGGDGYYQAALGYNRPAGLLLGEHKVVGHAKLGQEEFFFTNADQGDWFCYTGDGMLAGCIFGGPAGYGLRQWTMPEWEPGKVNLDDLRQGQEHYQGSVVKGNDEKIYAVAGHNHNSIVRVDGLEQMQRENGTVAVTLADLDKAKAWALQKAEIERLKQEPKVSKMPYITSKIGIDGSIDDWPEDLFVNIHDYWEHSLTAHDFVVHSRAALAYDSKYLYIAAWALDGSPMQNKAQENSLLFKGGDALDVLLGLDPNADPKRPTPVAGDIRILISRIKGEPVAMLYRHVAPGAPPEKRMHFQSPVGEVYIDQVKELVDADVAIQVGSDMKRGAKWFVEAAIPWESLGVHPPPVGSKIRGDVGVLQSDQNGLRTVNRLYWSGKSQTVVADIPSEARVNPSVWGEYYLKEPETAMIFGPDDGDLGP